MIPLLKAGGDGGAVWDLGSLLPDRVACHLERHHRHHQHNKVDDCGDDDENLSTDKITESVKQKRSALSFGRMVLRVTAPWTSSKNLIMRMRIRIMLVLVMMMMLVVTKCKLSMDSTHGDLTLLNSL